MSEAVHSLLVRGTAAAKAGDTDEARFYLEWVLNHLEAEADQQATAWLWLSRIAADPASQRECLASVLAINSTHPEARRELAILEGRLQPEELIDHRVPVAPIEPEARPAPSEVRRYVCPQCGGKMGFDAEQRALACSYCGHRMSEAQAILDGDYVQDVQEQDFIITLATVKAHRWELASARLLHCESCGADVALPPLRVSGACLFCGSTYVVATAERRELIQPGGVLLFQLDAGAAAQHVRRWLEAQRFRPDDLDQGAAILPPRGVYLPFWTFDTGGEVRWHGLVSKNDEWVPRSGNYLLGHDDLLVPASHSLPNAILSQLIDFDTSALVPYSTDLLADWAAEIYQIPVADASLAARQRALADAERHIKRRVLAEEYVRDLKISAVGSVIESYKLTLLPVWVSGYRYQGRDYLAVVNGQTGRVAGEVPRTGLQKFLAGLLGRN
jgi:hypothetical protein